MKKFLFIVFAVFILTTGVMGCGARTPTPTPIASLISTKEQIAQPTYTLYPTQIALTPYPTQVPPTPYPTKLSTPVPYHPSGDSARNVLLGNGFKYEGSGNYVYAATSDTYVKVILPSGGGFEIFALRSAYGSVTESTLVIKVLVGFLNGGAIPYEAADWLAKNISNVDSKPTTQIERFNLEDTVYLNNSGIEFIEISAIPLK